MALTSKQLAFAHGVASGLNHSEAYRQAYDAENMSPTTIRDEAYDLMQHPDVSPTIKALQQAVTDAAVGAAAWSLDRLVGEFEVNMELGRTINDRGVPAGLSASNGAITGIGPAYCLRQISDF